MDRLKLWLSAFRLRTLPLSVSGIIIGGCIAYYNGFFNYKIFILAILVTLGFQILSNLANDYGDGVKGTDNDDRIGPERAVQSGKITPEEMFDALKINILVVIFLTFMLIYASFGSRNFLFSMLFLISLLLLLITGRTGITGISRTGRIASTGRTGRTDSTDSSGSTGST